MTDAVMKGIFAIILIGLLTVSVLMGSDLSPADMGDDPKVVSQLEIDFRAYTPHPVIRINSDAEFASIAAGEGWSGDGTQGNPYIIEGYEIDAQGDGNCIYIGNTTVYFIVRNCYLYNTSYVSYPYFLGAGIMLYNVQNGALYNLICSSNPEGIYLYSSSSNTLSNNTISNNNNGIYLIYSSNNNVFSNNTISNNYNGIYFSYYSNSNTLSNNTLSNNFFGIYIYSCSGNTLHNNTMVECGIWLSGNSDTFTTQEIPTNNTVNGNPVYYYKNANMNNASVPLDAGQVLLGNVSWLRVENLNITNTSGGIDIGYSSNIYVANNTLSNNYYGIYLYSSSGNRLSNNTCTNNYESIYLYSSTGNTLSNNTASNNNNNGIYLISSSNSNTLSNNTVSNNYRGIYLFSSTDNTLSNNIVSNNYYGIYLYYSDSNTPSNNNCSNNNYGIYLYASNSNLIVGNSISNNTAQGAYIFSGSYNRLYSNIFQYNNGATDAYSSSNIQAYDDGSNNSWNSTSGYGNYWSDWTTPDNNGDGIVDNPYLIDGSAGAYDYYPLTTPTVIPEFTSALPLLLLLALVGLAVARRRYPSS